MVGKKSSFVVLAVVIAVFAVGFSSGYLLAQYSGVGMKSSSESTGMLITDDAGRNVTVPQPVDRIVSLAPSNTEILFALGLGERVVGVDQASDYPPDALNKTVVGGFFGGYNMEVITVLDPQLILASSINDIGLVEDLESRGFAVVILDAHNISGIFQDIELVGRITGRDSEASALVDDMSERVDAITSKTGEEGVQRPRVYIELDNQLWTYGPGSFGDSLIDLAGGENIAGNMSASYVKLDEEFIVSSSPEVIISVFTPVEEIKGRSGWSSIPAIQDDRVYLIDGDLIARPGPRIVDGLETLALRIHPELFP